MSALETFRAEIASWLLANAPKSLFGTRQGRFDGYWGGKKTKSAPTDVLRWRDVMCERGYSAPVWPKAYGGAGLSPEEARVFEEEMRRLRLPPPVVGFGLSMIGPTLLDYGTEEQKLEHLPKICRGEIRWCQGYSEPGAGSDLASLNTRARRDGDHFVLNGQKVWTSHADLSDWIFCLVRTSSGGRTQDGITFLLADLETPGISTRKIRLISGASPFCEVFFEDAKVPVKNVVGRIDSGWGIAKALLGYERSMIGEAISGQLRDVESDLVTLAREHLVTNDGRIDDPRIREGIAHLAMDEQCFELAVRGVEEAARAGSSPGPESSILKVYGSELKQRRYELAMQILGPQGLGWEGPGFDAVELATTREWLRSRANSIEGGTSEIQLNIIAKRVLGLGGESER